MFKEFFSKYSDDFSNCREYLKSIKTWYKLIPNLLTISRPIGIIPANILFFTGNVVPAILLTGCLLLTDLFDGKLARRWDVQSKLGADLDAVGDKIMFLGMALPLMISNPIMVSNVLFESAIALVNVLGRLKGLDTKTVYSGKVKTWFLSLTLGVGYLVKFFNLPVSILQTLVSLTAISQGIALSDYVGKYKEMELKNKITFEISKQLESEEESCQKETCVKELAYKKEVSLGMIESSEKYKGKRRVRKLIHEKRNSF